MHTVTSRIDRPKVVSRFLAIGAGAVLMASVSLVAATSASATSSKPAESDCWCVGSKFDRPVGVYNQAQIVDPGVGVYVGSDLTVTTATEIEGRVVVVGDADFDGSGTLNVGTAGGGGSATAPKGGTNQLVVGGNLTTGRKLQVGFNAAHGGGHVEVDGVRVFQDTQYFSRDILWVFPAATSIHLGANDQFPGTVVVPRAGSTLTVATSTNGRILAAGNVAYTGGSGIEHHNYPWSGECTDLPPVASTPTPTSAPAEDVSLTPTPVPTPTPTPTLSSAPEAAPTPAPFDVEEPSSSPSESPSPSPSADSSPSASPAVVVPGASDNDGNGDAAAPGQDGLARTGAAVTGAILAAVALLAGGAVLLRLRRRSGRHTVEP